MMSGDIPEDPLLSLIHRMSGDIPEDHYYPSFIGFSI